MALERRSRAKLKFVAGVGVDGTDYRKHFFLFVNSCLICSVMRKQSIDLILAKSGGGPGEVM